MSQQALLDIFMPAGQKNDKGHRLTHTNAYMHQGTYKSKVFVTYMTIVHCSFYLSLELLFIIPSLVCCPCLILVLSAEHVPNECEYELWKYFIIIIIVVVVVVVVVVDIIIKIPL